MGKYIDFVIPNCNTPEEAGTKVIEHLTINRLKANKPSIFFLTGDSGEGKNYTGLAIEKIVTEYYGLDLIDVVDPSVIFTPLEYTKKMNEVLFNKELKKLHIVMADEARDLINARLWYSYINMLIADINAIHRGIKPLVLLIVSQFIKDIDPSVRRTIQFYGKCTRPIGKNTLLYLNRLWKDDRDLDNPKLRKRRVKGYMKKEGGYRSVILDEIRVKLPPKNIRDFYDKLSFERKSVIIKKKFMMLEEKLKRELIGPIDKLDLLVKYYSTNKAAQNIVLFRSGNKWKVKNDIKKIHDLGGQDLKEFENRLLEELENKGVI